MIFINIKNTQKNTEHYIMDLSTKYISWTGHGPAHEQERNI